MFDDEIWHEIRDFPHYMISDHGRVKKVTTDSIRSININDRGFPIITLYGRDSKTRYLRQINKLVAESFLPPPTFDNEIYVWHLDGDLLNCRADNLRWETRYRVLAWNEMHRTGIHQYEDKPVLNVRTGKKYANAFECAMDEGRLEFDIFERADKGNPRYVFI